MEIPLDFCKDKWADYEGALFNCTGNVTWPGTEATGDSGSYQHNQNAGSLTLAFMGSQQQHSASPDDVQTSAK